MSSVRVRRATVSDADAVADLFVRARRHAAPAVPFVRRSDAAFQSNHRAHRFYERHGFVAVERTEGATNQEQAPDVRYVWRPG